MLEGHIAVQELLLAALQQGAQSPSASITAQLPASAQPARKRRTLDADAAPPAFKRPHGGARPMPLVQTGPELWLAAADVRCADAGATAAAAGWGRALSAPAHCGTRAVKGGANGPAPSELL